MYDFEQDKQGIGLVVGLLVGAMSLIRIGLELRFRSDPFTAMRAGELGANLGIVCLGGALLVVVVGWPRIWIGIIALALFAAFAPAHDQVSICRAQLRAAPVKQP